MEENKPRLYRAVRGLIRTVYPTYRVLGQEKLPDEPVILVGNHCRMHGPVAGELYAPGEHYIWSASEMLKPAEVAAYAYRDFWSGRPKAFSWFYRALSHLIAHPAAYLLGNSHVIPVYRDSRIITTFKQTIARLDEGCNVVIFPEQHIPHNHVLYSFQEHFIDVAKLYYKRTGRALAFVPMYLAPELHCFSLGDPIRFCPDAPIETERERICHELMQRITALAEALPEHRVVPYDNDIPKKRWLSNRDEGKCYEKTGG